MLVVGIASKVLVVLPDTPPPLRRGSGFLSEERAKRITATAVASLSLKNRGCARVNPTAVGGSLRGVCARVVIMK